MNETILYCTAYNIIVYLWHGKKLMGETTFSYSSEDLNLFSDFLKKNKKKPLRVLVDIAEEDFRHESIPNVGGSDRKSIISRLFSRHYRDDKYINAHKLSRSSSGRKDARVLLSSLGDNKKFDEFITRILDEGNIISGIWSLPLISQSILKKLSTKESFTLLMSRQSEYQQRETFYSDYELNFSRKTSFNEADDDKESFNKKIDQIVKYLTNQRIMSFSDKLTIVCIYDERSISFIKENLSESPLIAHRYFTINEVMKSYGIDCSEQDYASALFSYICSTLPISSEHYLNGIDKKPYQFYRLKNFIKVASSLAAAALIGTSAFALSNYYQTTKKIAKLETDYQKLKDFYEENYQIHSESLSTAQELSDMTEKASKLTGLAQHSPFNLFVPFSHIYSNPKFQYLALQTMQWRSEVGINKDSAKRKLGVPLEEDVNYDSEHTSTPIYTIALSGHISRPFKQYRDNLALINDWKNKIDAMSETGHVALISIPSDIRPTKEFTDTIGDRQVSEDNAYQYEIFMEIPYEQP